MSAPTRGVWVGRLSSPAVIRLTLLLYGVLLAGVTVHRLNASIPDQPVLMGTRSTDIDRSIRSLDTGGPPLLACIERFSTSPPLIDPFAASPPRNACYPAGTGDDQGVYLFVPLLVQATGLDSPEEGLKWLYILLFGLLALVSPLIFYALFESIAAALFAPAAIVFHFGQFANTDIYWISAWCYLLAIPLLLLVYKKWGRYSLFGLAGVVAIGSFATSIRIHAGLPILLGALIVVLLRRTSLLRLAAATAVLFLAYLTFAGVLAGVREYRDHAVGDPGLSERYPTRHPFWHNAYIGLGYLPNRYGIEWNDNVASEFVRLKEPSAQYLSPRYERTLRDEYFRIVREDPALVVRNLVAKLGLTLDTARDRFGLVLLLAPFALFVGRARHEWRRYLLIAAPALLLSLPPPLLTMPVLQYQLGWLGAWATLWLLLACWALTVAPAEICSRLSARAREGRRSWAAQVTTPLRSAGLIVAVGLISLVSLFADVLGPRAARPSEEFVWGNQATALQAPMENNSLERWDFRRRLPSGWTILEGTKAEPGEGAVQVVTNDGRSEFQLMGPAVRLPAGRYELRARASVADGGLELGALDANADAWLATTRYWHGQNGFASRDIVTPFTISKPGRVRAVLSNWRASPDTSRWLIRRVWIRRA